MTRARGASRPRFRLLPTVLLTLAILAVPTVVYAWGRSSSSFGITTVKLSGTRLVPEKKTLKLLQASYAGDNLFTVTAEDVRGTLAQQPFVAAVTVDRAFPHTLEVAIKEYVPAAYVRAGSRWYVVGESGYVICTAADAAEQLGKTGKTAGSAASTEATTAPDAAGSAGPEVAGSATSTDGTSGSTGADGSASTGDEAAAPAALTARLVAGPERAVLPLPRIAAAGRVRVGDVLDDEVTAQKLAVITALPNSYRRTLAAVEEKKGQLKLRFDGGPVATWGDAGRTLAKTVALRTVLAAYRDAGKTCTRIDVSIPDRTLAEPVLQ